MAEYEHETEVDKSIHAQAVSHARSLAQGNADLESSLAEMYLLKHTADAARKKGEQENNPALAYRVYSKMNEILTIVGDK